MAVFTAGVRNSPVIEDKLVGWGHGVNPQLGETDPHVHVL